VLPFTEEGGIIKLINLFVGACSIEPKSISIINILKGEEQLEKNISNRYFNIDIAIDFSGMQRQPADGRTPYGGTPYG